ncbi:MAG: non-ribosomal peptide synthetase, partial [Acidimicrobiales bacterium]
MVRSYRGASLRRNLSPDLTDRIHRASARTAATPFQVTLAAFCVLLARLSDDDEIVVGSGLANRRRPEVAEVVGMMVNTVVIRADFGGNPTVADAIARVRTRVVGAMENQELPFEEVVRALDPPRRPGHLPYVDHLFSFHDTPFPSLDGGDVAVRVADTLSNGSAKADLNVVVVNRRGRDLGPSPEGVGLTVVWEYSSDVFDASTAEALLDAYVTLLDAMVDHLDEPIASLAHTTHLDDAVDAPRLDYERDASIDEVFAQRAVEDSDALAVVAGAVTLTYGELNDASHRLARRLWTLGVEPGECIGVVDDRTASMVVSLLGVLRAGAAYVGIDPTAPPTRQARVRELAGVRVVLASEGGASRIEPGVDVVEVDARGFGRTRVRVSRPPTAPLNGNGPRSLAYVSFTSGSTGEPKGVEVAHRGVVRLARGARFVEWRRGDAVYAGAPLAFDASTFEIFGPLLNGARVVMAPPGPLSVAEIGDVLVEYGVTTAWFTAGLFHQLVDHGLARLTALRQILAGGDVLSTSHVNRLVRELRGDARFVAGYGPTEGTTFSCALVLSRGDEVEGTVPLGGPLDNTAVAVLDRAGHAVPSGLAGELWIGGDGVALGYVARPDLTAERFSSDVLDGRLGEWAYRTGDRVRRRGGSLEFLGRVDRQVKVRGFRVEPSEVEAALLRLAGVARAHVEPVAYGRDDRRLVAYVVSSPGDVVDPDRLTRALRDTLPAHMVPAVIVGVDELPLRANGKIDPTQLPEPPSTWFDEDPSNPLTPLTSVVAAPVAGASALENTLVALWQEVIGVRRIGLDDDFFDLGGHSLLAVELFAAIERATGARLRLATIFEAPTVARMAHVLRASGVDAEVGSLVALTTTGDRTPIFAVTAGDGNAVGFGPLARRLGSDQPFYVLQPRGLDGTAPLHRSVEAMAGFYVEEIRTVQPTGPYVLVGRCFGSLVAYEMARQLEATGEVVALLASIDSGGPLWQTRHLANGTDYDPTMNEARVRAHQDGIDFGDVFGDAVAADSFQQWLVEPATRVGDVDVSRYLHSAYLARPDVRAAYPLTGEWADPEGLLRWAWDSGRPEMGMQAALLAAADAVVGRKPRRTSKPRPERARR